MIRLLLLSLLTAMSVPADSLDRHRWKHRLIVVALPDEGEARKEALEYLEALQRDHAEALADRDLRWIDGSGESIDLPGTIRPPDHPGLREQLKLTDEDRVSFVLIGKDGGVKDRQSGKLDLKAWFRLIDSMPMRQREMRK